MQALDQSEPPADIDRPNPAARWEDYIPCTPPPPLPHSNERLKLELTCTASKVRIARHLNANLITTVASSVS